MPYLLPLLGLAMIAVLQWRRWQHDQAALRELKARPLPAVTLGNTPTVSPLPKVSVLVAGWNEAQMIEDHIGSFLNLRYPNRELILCVGGEDDTYTRAVACAAPNIHILQQPSGEGKQQALKRCLEVASGEIFYLTDADCLYDDESFERTLSPIISEGQEVCTGGSRPLDRQLDNPLALHVWFTDLYSRSRWGEYTNGILGRNAALTRRVLDTIGGFHVPVPTGTDYHLAKQVLRHGYSIRHAAGSAIQTRFAETLTKYRTQQTRWLRNIMLHGIQFKEYREAAQAVLASLIGMSVLALSVIGLIMGPPLLTAVLLLWVFILISRVRYMRFGEVLTGVPFGRGYLLLPLFTLLDFGLWSLTLVQSIVFNSELW